MSASPAHSLARRSSAVRVSKNCLRCICQARGCDWSVGCQNDVCGAYMMNEDYFITSNVTSRANLYKAYTFQRCASNPACATLAVKLFLQKLPSDCDGDGIIDCDDFVKEHYYGPNGFE
ncbi:invertebrate-type lysozyme 3-like [Pollicipes pollicipes]|uniref:invertebrate-type lysozyme 3-like n=1 Tax=Pollicipes pollicipes TaxID=41117 RepID=UPI0018852664|nr:invertebrate-type lysozyme 3-like [Pollicipes pollicipes]